MNLLKYGIINKTSETEDEDSEGGFRGGSVDERVYICRTWRLEPKLRFLYWNSALEAPGVDSILQQLGFRHAKVYKIKNKIKQFYVN